MYTVFHEGRDPVGTKQEKSFIGRHMPNAEAFLSITDNGESS